MKQFYDFKMWLWAAFMDIAILVGFKVYSTWIYPSCPIQVTGSRALIPAAQLYAVNVLAFICLAYCFLRPFFRLLDESLDLLFATRDARDKDFV